MKILVTGGAGYIGSHVVLSLCEKGYEVAVLDDLSTGNREAVDSRAEFIKGSTLNNDDLETAVNGVDAVVHLAALKAAGESMIDPGKYSHNNISGTINLLNAMMAQDVTKFVFSSTAAVYGLPQYLPLDENHPLNPINYYGFTKLEIERILKWYGELKGLKFAVLRYFNAAGYDPWGRITSLENDPANLLPIVMEVASGKRGKMEVFGNDYNTKDGTGVRDYIHVSDLASAHVKAIEYLEKNESLTVNLATGERHSVMDVINLAKEISGQEIPFEIVGRRAGDPAELYAGTNMAFDRLDWTVEYSDLKTLLETTWKVYQK
ncbi:MAG: UDP-glucose 4-epimerase GalE [Candidatus Marinimicrobia bacterium]|nr:UDP-glucose 4-epimerase GalE [Candidatus Neomarinimicrobiota bacterium]